MIHYLSQTRQIVATNFRTGSVSPAKDNLDFIKISQDALPSRPLKTQPNQTKPNQNHPFFPTIQINKTAFYPTPQKILGILQKISPVLLIWMVGKMGWFWFGLDLGNFVFEVGSES